MKEIIFRNKLINSSKITLIIFQLFFLSSFYGQSLQLTSSVQYVNLGDLDISGNQLTVEAKIYMTGSSVNIVSKHTDPSNVNYLLRPKSFEITTSNGFYFMDNPFELELNKWYHIAGTYDGQYVRYYVNGCLVIQNPATGNLFQNGNIFTSGGGGSSQWTTSGANIYYNVLNGNVGIGTTTPYYTLDVGGSANVGANVYCMNMFILCVLHVYACIACICMYCVYCVYGVYLFESACIVCIECIVCMCMYCLYMSVYLEMFLQIHTNTYTYIHTYNTNKIQICCKCMYVYVFLAQYILHTYSLFYIHTHTNMQDP